MEDKGERERERETCISYFGKRVEATGRSRRGPVMPPPLGGGCSTRAFVDLFQA